MAIHIGYLCALKCNNIETFGLYWYENRICLSKGSWRQNSLHCPCHPSCNSIDYTLTYRGNHDDYSFRIETEVRKIRIKRDVLFSTDFLVGLLYYVLFNNFPEIPYAILLQLLSLFFIQFDLIPVSIGGSAALFLGCSFISVAEMFYFIAVYLREKYSNKSD